MLFKSEESGAEELEVMKRVQGLGLEATPVDKTELRKLQPGLNSDIQGGIHYKCDAHTTPTQLMERFKSFLPQAGVEIHTGTAVTGFNSRGNTLTGVRTTQGSFEADEIVMASGAWSPLLSKKLGVNLPLQAGKGYRIDVTRPTPVRIPVSYTHLTLPTTPY